MVDMTAVPAATGRTRITALDQTRGLAIICMILSHFGPGLYERVGIGGTVRDLLDLIGRMATPMFVLIFGLTLAIAYMPKARRDPAPVRRALLRRSVMVFACSIVVVLPSTLTGLYDEGMDMGLYRILLQQYSVLSFYTVAIAITGLACRFLAPDPLRNGALAGSILIFVGTLLGYDSWQPNDGSPDELARMLFVSGKYGVLVLLGASWMTMGLGEFIRRQLREGRPFRRDILIIAVAMMLLALSQGRIVGWRTLADLAQQYAAPPQIWFFMLAGGAMLACVAVLDRYRIPVAGFVLEHVGRNPLTIYLAHAFVLPAVALIRELVPALPDALVTIGCMGVFLAVCAAIVYRSARIRPGSGVTMGTAARSMAAAA